MDESSEVADALRCRILSLDGAGAKGFYTSGVLNQLEALLGGQPLCTKFNLIFGSSTGAIIASLLALGKSVAEIRALYEEHVPKVMGRKLASTRSKALERLAADVFKDARFTDGYHAYPETFGTLLVALSELAGVPFELWMTRPLLEQRLALRGETPGMRGLVGRAAPRNIAQQYLQKRVPDAFRTRGAANPEKQIVGRLLLARISTQRSLPVSPDGRVCRAPQLQLGSSAMSLAACEPGQDAKPSDDLPPTLHAGRVRIRRLWSLLLGAELLLLAAMRVAASEVTNIPIVEAPPGTPALGGGLRLSSDPLIADMDSWDLVPLYLYEGKRLFAHGTEFGAYLYRNDLFTVAAFGRARFTHVEAGDDPRLVNLDDRRQTLDGGVLAQLRGGWGQLQGEWLTDMLDRHEGQEANLTYRYRWEVNDNLMLSPFITWTWQDSRLVGYYYGVSAAEAGPGLPEYNPGDAHNFSYGINTWYRLADHIFLFANVGSTTYDGAIQNSPLMSGAREVEGFLGAGYLFGNVHKSDRVEEGREGEWTWRVNAGYVAKENIVPHFMIGNWERSDLADTPIGGFTLGRLLNGGPRVDFYGRLALFRHFERDNQDDFWNYTAYIMAMGKGYSPWSGKLAFRYGFGFGFSYAEEVPTVETIKQTRNDENTSRLLNYLEFQVDFPIDRLIPAKSLRNCFTGIAVVHRSGIFGTADILGQVSGGSDWMTFHLECVR